MLLASHREERFWAKVEKGAPESCWLWTGSINGGGYGHFRVGDRVCLAHRVAYMLRHGEIPEGLHLDHLCRVRNCVNPAHLEPVTCHENLMRGNTEAAANTGKTHCPKGHPYAGDNLYLHPRGSRVCRTCQREARARYDARRSQTG